MDEPAAPDQPHLAFICAMPMEMVPLRRRLGLERTTVQGVDVSMGRLDGRPVVATVTGMGTELARKGTTRLLDAVAADRVIVFGITGAVDNDTPIGTLVVPEVVVNSNTGAEFRPAPLGDTVPRGRMWTTDVITPADEATGLHDQGVVSLDMETAAIAEVCEQRGIPWSVFRVISDRATDGSVDPEVFAMSDQNGRPNPARVIKFFLRNPGRIPAMARLAKGARQATQTAADAAITAARAAKAP